MISYVYDGTLEGLISAAVYAFRSKKMPDRIVSADEIFQPVLFEEVIEIPADTKTAERGMKYLKKDMNLLIHAYLFDTGCDYAVLVKCLCGLFKDIKYLNRHNLSDVDHVRKCAKRTLKETHRMVEFIRFKELDDGFFMAEIEPYANVLGLIAEHFVKRLGNEKWMIYDRLRHLLLVYDGSDAAYYNDAEMTGKPHLSDNEKHFEELWKVFFQSIAIKERINPKLQKQHVPDKYRHLMTEFR